MKYIKPVSEKYFGQVLGNTQDPDSLDDEGARRAEAGNKIGGRGSVSGGSKTISQRIQTTTGNKRGGSYPLKGSYPKNAQKLRG